MAPQPIDAELAPGPLQHLHHITDAHHQRLTQVRQGLAQLHKRLPAEEPLPLGGIGLLPQLRLHHVQRQHQAPIGSSNQGPVINDAQITLEPNDLQRCHSLQFKGIGSSGSGAPSKPQSTDISITALKRVFTVLRKSTTSKRRVINAAPRKQTICRAKTPP